MISAFGIEHGSIAKSERTSRLAGDAALTGGGAALAAYGGRAARPLSTRYAAKAAGHLLRGDPRALRSAAGKAVVLHRAAPLLRGAGAGLGAASVGLGAAAIEGALADRKKKTPELPPPLGTPRKGRYAS